MSQYQLLTLKLDDIELIDRAREDYKLDEDFLESIRDKGIIQPITVTRQDSGKYRVLAGGRRYSGACKLGLDTIPCIVREASSELDNKEIEFLENAQRRDLTWQERLKLVVDIQRLMAEKHGETGSQRKTAKFLDKSVGGINRVVQLARTIETFPQLLECSTEDEAVKRARKILEGALVKTMAKKHRESALPEGEESIVDTITDRSVGEGFDDDPYINSCRRALSHYRIGDCIEGMQEMIVDGLTPPIILVEIDPPYGIDIKEQKKGEGNKALDIYEEIDRDKYPEFTRKLLELVYEVTPKDCRIIYWFGIEWYEMIFNTMQEVGFSVDHIPCIWTKGSGQTNDPDRYLARTYEPFFIATKGAGTPIANRGRANVFHHSPVPHTSKYHPTQKPLSLMEDILSTFGWPGGIVMCPFLGSGVTLRAAYRKQMLPFGWELNKENLEPFLAALEGDIDAYKTNVKPDELDDEIPF